MEKFMITLRGKKKELSRKLFKIRQKKKKLAEEEKDILAVLSNGLEFGLYNCGNGMTLSIEEKTRENFKNQSIR